jgi:hypothetical protein
LSKIILSIRLSKFLIGKNISFTFDSSDKEENDGDMQIIDETEQTSAALSARIHPTFQPRNIM